jgi:hypothetical protein
MGRGREREKHFLFLMQEMGAKTPLLLLFKKSFVNAL